MSLSTSTINITLQYPAGEWEDRKLTHFRVEELIDASYKVNADQFAAGGRGYPLVNEQKTQNRFSLNQVLTHAARAARAKGSGQSKTDKIIIVRVRRAHPSAVSNRFASIVGLTTSCQTQFGPL